MNARQNMKTNDGISLKCIWDNIITINKSCISFITADLGFCEVQHIPQGLEENATALKRINQHLVVLRVDGLVEAKRIHEMHAIFVCQLINSQSAPQQESVSQTHRSLADDSLEQVANLCCNECSAAWRKLNQPCACIREGHAHGRTVAPPPYWKLQSQTSTVTGTREDLTSATAPSLTVL